MNHKKGTRQHAVEAKEGKEARPKRGRGRPRKVIDWDKVAFLANMGSTKEEIAAGCNVSVDTLERGKNKKIFAGILEGGVYRANISIRRVLFGTLRGRLIDPKTGEEILVPIQERIAMAKYLAQRKTYLDMAERTDVTSGGKPLAANVLVVDVGADTDDDTDPDADR